MIIGEREWAAAKAVKRMFDGDEPPSVRDIVVELRIRGAVFMRPKAGSGCCPGPDDMEPETPKETLPHPDTKPALTEAICEWLPRGGLIAESVEGAMRAPRGYMMRSLELPDEED